MIDTPFKTQPLGVTARRSMYAFLAALPEHCHCRILRISSSHGDCDFAVFFN
ncbi:MAG: hypothetical protein KDA72_16920 [Planctomycetales bacterium]|nr:hypothetical protein [Planctomycetales bacterium]